MDPLYSLRWNSVCVRPNGNLSFSYNMNNPFVFGKAYESIKIPMDEKFYGYIALLKKADEFVLNDSKEQDVEYDTLVDKYLSVLI